MLHGAHIVEAIRQLDEQHADIAGDGDEQLAEVLGLFGFLRDKVELLDLGKPVDKSTDLLAEQLIDLGSGGVCVLDHVMQERGGNGRIIELEVGEDRRHFEGMRKVRVAVCPLLMLVRLHGVNIGAIKQGLIGLRIIA